MPGGDGQHTHVPAGRPVPVFYPSYAEPQPGIHVGPMSGPAHQATASGPDYRATVHSHAPGTYGPQTGPAAPNVQGE